MVFNVGSFALLTLQDDEFAKAFGASPGDVGIEFLPWREAGGDFGGGRVGCKVQPCVDDGWLLPACEGARRRHVEGRCGRCQDDGEGSGMKSHRVL